MFQNHPEMLDQFSFEFYIQNKILGSKTKQSFENNGLNPSKCKSR